MEQRPIVIVGAGAAGLAAAASLKEHGLEAMLLDRDDQIGGTWARRYDRLHLHTVRTFSGLPHYPIPRHFPRYLPKDRFAEYLQDYARHFELKVVLNGSVRQVRLDAEASAPVWLVESGRGTWRCRVVVLATGEFCQPVSPQWPGTESYQGPVLHSVKYRSAREFVGRRVLVVGTGNSGTEIATDLAEQGASFVAIAVRTPPFVAPRDLLGVPVQVFGIALSSLPPHLADACGRVLARLALGNLARYGLSRAEWSPFNAQRIPVIDVGFVDHLKRGRIHLRPMVERLTAEGVVYVDGYRERFDAVVAATGFRTGLEDMLDLPGLLDAHGRPTAPSGRPTPYPGLYFIGYAHTLRGHLFELYRDALQLAPTIARYLRQTQSTAGGSV